MKMISKSAIYTFLLLLSTAAARGQFVVDGSDITIQSGAEVYIDTDFINQSSGLTDNQGKITVTGDWLNNGMNNSITLNTGEVELSGNTQLIGGTRSTTFNNLSITAAGTKILGTSTQIGSVGTLNLSNGLLSLNGNTLEILNPFNTAIVRNSGGIVSETDLVASLIKWNFNTGTGVYEFPTMTTSGTYIPVLVDVTISGNGAGGGFMSISTYPTNDSNRNLPLGVANMNLNGRDVSLSTVDRFWDINVGNFMILPTSTVTFSYDSINDLKLNNIITEDSLVVLRGNPTWVDFGGVANSINNTVTVSTLNSYGNFTLYSSDNITSLNEFNTTFRYVKSFYPNPSTGYSKLTIDSKVNTEMNFQFFNSVGQLVMERQQYLNSGVNNVEFDLTNLPNGIYHIALKANTLIDYSKLIISK